jgi:diguanylate cyclase (GGDEF)-like protein
MVPSAHDTSLDRPAVAAHRDGLLDAVLEATRDGIMSLSAVRDGRGRMVDALVLTANGPAGTYAGHPVPGLVGGRLRELLPAFAGAGLWERCVAVVEERRTERFELDLGHDGRDTWLRFTLAPLADGFVMSFGDVTDLKYALFEAELARQDLAAEIEGRRRLEAELRRLSVTDDLTGVLNRRGFADAVRAQAALAARHGWDLALLALDIDHFKAVNDRHGHAGGDAVLRAVAALFTGMAGSRGDLVGRVGGEEFMILLPRTDLAGALDAAEALRAAVEALAIPAGPERIRVTTSIGVHAVADGAPERMLLDADKALYRAKALGRNRIVAFEPA